MSTLKGTKSTGWRAGIWALVMTAAVGLSACSHVMAMMGHGAQRPAASEFGFGPRTSAAGRFTGTLETDAELRPRRLQTVRVILRDSNGQSVEGAAIRIDGGMPQHGHGLPTKPQVTQELGDGRYLVEGMKFNMPGWWKLEVRIDGAAGSDTATFNLAL